MTREKPDLKKFYGAWNLERGEAKRVEEELRKERGRIGKELKDVDRKNLSDFHGVLSQDSGKKLEKAVKERRRINKKLHKARLKRITREMKK